LSTERIAIVVGIGPHPDAAGAAVPRNFAVLSGESG